MFILSVPQFESDREEYFKIAFNSHRISEKLMVTKVININVLTNKFEYCLLELNAFYKKLRHF